MPSAVPRRPSRASSIAPTRLFPALLGTALLAALAGCGGADGGDPFARSPAAALPLRIAPDLVVRAVRFGVLETAPDGSESFVALRELPPERGTSFGWVIELETTRPAVRWQERLRLPAATDWGDVAGDPGVRLGADGRTAEAAGVASVAAGTATRFYWSLAPGDPPGEYRLEVAIEGRAVAGHVFTVAAPVRERAILVRAAAREPAILGDPGTARANGWR